MKLAYANAEDRKAYHREWYAKNKEKRRAQLNEHRALTVEQNRKNFLELIQASTCMDCGSEDWRVFQMDHRDPSTKKYNIAQMICNSYKWETIMREIEKCDIVCANCHIIRTGIMFDFFRFRE